MNGFPVIFASVFAVPKPSESSHVWTESISDHFVAYCKSINILKSGFSNFSQLYFYVAHKIITNEKCVADRKFPIIQLKIYGTQFNVIHLR